MRLNAEKALATILAAARNDPSKHDAAWETVTKAADQLRPENHPHGRIPPESLFAYSLINTRRLRGEKDAYDLAHRVKAIPALWRTQR